MRRCESHEPIKKKKKKKRGGDDGKLCRTSGAPFPSLTGSTIICAQEGADRSVGKGERMIGARGNERERK